MQKGVGSVASHLSAIGFPVTSEEEFHQLVVQAATEGVPVGPGRYTRWAPGEGVELWVQVHNREIVGMNPHFGGKSRLPVRVSSLRPHPEYPLDGKLQGWINSTGEKAEDGIPVLFDLPDFDLARPKAQEGAVVTVQVAAFAHDLSCFPSDEAFVAAQEEPRFAAESYFPLGLFGAEEGENPEPEALALFAGHIRSARLATNPVTGRHFHVLQVETLGCTFDVIADPDSVTGAPEVGGVAQGTFWLSGRIIPEPNRRGIMPAGIS